MIALSRFLEKMLKALVIVANAAMLLLVFGQVITRYVFGWTPHFGEELARYLFVWVVFLSLPLVARYGGHMCIETLTSRVKGVTLKTLQTSPAMMIPMSWVYVVIPFGCGVMLLYVLGNLMRVLKTPAAELK